MYHHDGFLKYEHIPVTASGWSVLAVKMTPFCSSLEAQKAIASAQSLAPSIVSGSNEYMA